MSLDNQNIQLEILKVLQKLSEKSSGTNNTEQFVAMNITEFTFDPENRGTFRKWFRRDEDLFDSDAKDLEDVAKIRLLLRKLDAQAHNKYTNYILPKLLKELSFKKKNCRDINENFRNAEFTIQSTLPLSSARQYRIK